ncbi:MAG: tRNA preQ1(34) S-adenosylmethionine ribosyltransferase-isomerase QueA [Coxiellaceae bacterium]|nr:tRNA preQ1(34) S-adenosylmethionine ribosyltransferase-isomerase QueA [Coxiellaceae bacterium]
MSHDHISSYDYHLPEQLIAQYPLSERSASRLLYLDAKSQSFHDKQFVDVIDLLEPNDLLVVNDTRVFPARLYGKKETGGKVECLVERVLSDRRALVHLKSSKSPKPETMLIFSDVLRAKVIDRAEDLFLLEFNCEGNLFECLEEAGQVPLPPYIERVATDSDKNRYQTIYAKELGAVAAPTAGLHFSEEIMKVLEQKGVKVVHVTLHVGAGTFQPLRVEQLDAHKMHQEYINVSQSACEAINTCQGRVVAVGTTTLRALESASRSGKLAPYEGDTDIFIRPGFTFHCVDALITNFHLPKSTLLMLVAAFSGYELMMKAYQHAIAEQYRFYSYGDAMFIKR